MTWVVRYEKEPEDGQLGRNTVLHDEFVNPESDAVTVTSENT
jgi:hypothetical protein